MPRTDRLPVPHRDRAGPADLLTGSAPALARPAGCPDALPLFNNSKVF